MDQIEKPRRIFDFIGQDNLRLNLGILIAAARKRGEALEHLLFAKQQGIAIDIDDASLIAEYSNGLPAQALTILKRVDKYASVLANGQITLTVTEKALELVDRKDKPSPRE